MHWGEIFVCVFSICIGKYSCVLPLLGYLTASPVHVYENLLTACVSCVFGYVAMTIDILCIPRDVLTCLMHAYWDIKVMQCIPTHTCRSLFLHVYCHYWEIYVLLYVYVYILLYHCVLGSGMKRKKSGID